MDKKYDIEIERHASNGIRALADMIGATHMRKIGHGYSPDDGQPDHCVVFYAIDDPRSGRSEILVASTNGDPMWEDEDATAFAELAEECGVKL